MGTRFLLTTSAVLGIFLSSVFAQRIEAGAFFGFSSYLGDLQRPHVEVLEINQARGVFTRYNFSSILAVKSNFYWGSISGSDANYRNLEPAISQRNLSFRSEIYELGVQAELSYLRFGEIKNHRSGYWPGGSPKRYRSVAYLLVGVSGFYFNPKALYGDEWYALQPLGTEGQNLPGSAKEKYRLFQLSIPCGMGFKINLNDWSAIGFEVGLRKTFTDYLDDVSETYPDIESLSTLNSMAAVLSYRSPEVSGEANVNPVGLERGNSKSKDLYLFAGLTVAVVLFK